jgi:hypothetical protein
MVTGLNYYRQLIGGSGSQPRVELSPDECAAVLQIHDYGLAAPAQNQETAQLLYSLIGKLKDQIWP